MASDLAEGEIVYNATSMRSRCGVIVTLKVDTIGTRQYVRVTLGSAVTNIACQACLYMNLLPPSEEELD